MRLLLIPALLLQAGLLLFRLGLLPAWTDEHDTLTTVAQPAARLVTKLHTDVHPPLYFLLARGWAQLPLPGTLLERLRALSALLALLTTAAVYLLLFRNEGRAQRTWFLLLWVLSPCLLLYGRMARSYTAQLLLAVLTFYAFERLLEAPARRWTLAYAAGAALCVYTHYSTGAAVLAGGSAVLAWRWLRKGDRAARTALIASLLLVTAAMLPLALAMPGAIGRWASSGAHGVHWLSPLEHGVKVAFTGFSFVFGETPPAWGLVASALTAPLVAAAILTGLCPVPAAVAVAAGVAYLAVSRWVSFPFVPARLLFLLPFVLLVLARYRHRALLCAGLLIIYAGSIAGYFSKTGYLNKAYTAPIDEMAAFANRGAAPVDTLFVVDYYNSDTLPFVDRLRKDVPLILIDGEASTRRVLAAAESGVRHIWYWRNTHDVSPGRLHERLEAELGAHFRVERHLFVPYGAADRLMMRLLGWPAQPTHLYQLLEFSR